METVEPHARKSVGAILKEQLARRGWTQSDLADIVGQPANWVNHLASDRKAVDADVAVALGAAFGTTAEYWLNLDAAYRLAHSQVQASVVEERAKIFNKAPVKEMVRRGWIEDSKDLSVLEQNLLRFFDINTLDDNPQPIPHAARKSTDYTFVTPPQMAWLFRARNLAKGVAAAPFFANRFQRSLGNLKTLLEHPSEIRRMPAILAEGGVRVLVVQPLGKSKIDGACFWLDSKSPVVVLSMRYDRIDYFWHTLWHELGHVHYQDGFALDHDMMPQKRDDDADARPEFELMADAFALDNLVDQSKMDDFILRVSPLFSKNRLTGFAKLRSVHPGVVAGQLQHRGEIGYNNHRNLLVKVRDVVTESALTDGFGQMLPPHTA